MSIILSSKNFPLPVQIGHLIQLHNKGSSIQEISKYCWSVESSTLYCYTTWFRKIFPDPWGSQIFKLLYILSTAPYRKFYTHCFVISDMPLTAAELLLPHNICSFLSELGEKYGLHEWEVIIGILQQTLDTLTKMPSQYTQGIDPLF